MAEFINEQQQLLLPEYEQMKKFEICTNEQIKECIRKRESFHTKISQSEKSIRDYADFILFERKVHKWVNEKEKVHGSALTGLKTSIATRIIRMCREGLRKFPHEERFWRNYLQFSKESVPHEVSGIYEKMLTFHGDSPKVWCDAALWTYEYTMNMEKVKSIFYRALQRHPESETINKTFFDIMLKEALKMSTDKNMENNTVSEQEFGLKRVEVLYRNCKKRITNVGYFLRLLDTCEQEKFMNMTAPLQKIVLDDIMQTFPREEALWDALAQRELRGFNMSDLGNINIDYKMAPVSAGNVESIATLFAAIGGSSQGGVDECDIKDPNIKGVWQKRTLKRRIELCCNVYETAVRTLETQEMWRYYINAMLKLNQDTSTQQVLKRKRLAIAFKGGHESGLMSIDHYCTFVNMLLESENGIQIAESVLSEAVKSYRSLKLYEIWLSMYIVENNEPKVFEVFQKANTDLGSAHTFPLWRLTLQFYKTRYDDCSSRLSFLYKEACKQLSPEFGVIRGEFLEYLILNQSMETTRQIYDEMCLLQPPCLELHQKMALLESQITGRTSEDSKRWRLCYEQAVNYFGKTQSKVWIDFIKFERDHGEPKRMSALYQRAINTLEVKLVDNFISEYTLLTAII